MTRYVHKATMEWTTAPVRGGVDMEKSVVWEGDFGVRSAFFRMPAGMTIPGHTHPKWVQVMVLDGEIEVAVPGGVTERITAGGCYFVEPGDSHTETALEDSLVLVTQGEDRPEFQQAGGR